jgi:hypothetical protein
VNLATVILILAMATAFVAIVEARRRWDWPTDYQLLIMGVVFTSFAALMFFKCGGWLCSFGTG